MAQQLIRALDPSYEVRSHSPFAASDDSAPEPDISVSRRKLHLPGIELTVAELFQVPR